MRITLISARFTYHPFGSGNFIHKALTALGHEVFDIDVVRDRRRFREMLQEPCDLLLAYNSHQVDPRLIEKMDCPTALWFVDDVATVPVAYKQVKNVGYAYDKVYYFDDNHVDMVRSISSENATFLPCATDLDIYARAPGTEKKNDVLFVGNMENRFNANRRQLVERLRKAGFQVTATTAFMQEMVDLINASKVVLNIAKGPSGYPLRVFETMGCGAFMLTNAVDGPQLFTDRKELVYFNDQNVEELVGYYLEHDEERERIAAAGYQAVVAGHTFMHRVEQVLGDLAELTERAESRINHTRPMVVRSGPRAWLNALPWRRGSRVA